MAVSKLLNSSFTKRLTGKIDDAIDSGIKNLRKNPNFKKLDKGTQNRITSMKMPGKVQSEVVDEISNGASNFKNRFGTKLVKNADGSYDDLGFRIGKQRESTTAKKIAQQSSKPVAEVDDLADEIANMRQRRINEGLASSGGVSITDSTITQRQQRINEQRNMEKRFYDKEKHQETLRRREEFKTSRENGTIGMPKRTNQNNGPSGGNKNKSANNKDPKGNGNNYVYKMAAAGVGGGLVLSMANNKGQQSNQQLYGQGGY